MSELNDEELDRLRYLIGEDRSPTYLLRPCHVSALASCPVCHGDFQTQVGFQVAVDDTPFRRDASPERMAHQHWRRFLCPTCARREAPYFIAAQKVANEAFFENARRRMELKDREAKLAAAEYEEQLAKREEAAAARAKELAAKRAEMLRQKEEGLKGRLASYR